MRVAVVTPTIGSEHLEQCIESVNKQTYDDVVHYIVKDGFDVKIPSYVNHLPNVKLITLDENVGKGWYGHRVYAACSFLVNADVICYLDEDNWFALNHVEEMVKTLKEGNDWCYSLRNIVDKNGEFICEDNCESLGKWPVYFNHQVYHIDTSCFAIRRDIAVRIGHAWYGQWGADRQFFNNLKQHFTKWNCTNQYSVNYRLDGNEGSVTKDFFEKGNELSKAKYEENYPWLEKSRMTEVGPGISIVEKNFE